jgi:hypothetical protein
VNIEADDGVGGLVRMTRSRLKSLAGGLLDLIFPPRTLDDGAHSLTGGLSAEAWSRIQFLDGPVCDGCGQPVALITRCECPAPVSKRDNEL